MHILFGTILAVDNTSLFMVTGITTFTLCVLAIIYRPLLIECFDPGFLRVIGGWGGMYHFLFLVLVALNLVAAFQALGTLMALGMMLPGMAAGWIQEKLGYTNFFLWVCVATIPSFVATALLKVDPAFGKKA